MLIEHFTAEHEGYMDGLLGNDPKSDYDSYESGWLHGAEDKGIVDPNIFKEPDFKKGDIVAIPKGIELLYNGGVTRRMIKVKLHGVYPMIPAHFDYRHVFCRPKPPTILWAGSGGYWNNAYAHQVTKVEP